MRDRQTLAVWILGLLVVAHHHQVCAGNDHFGSFVGLYTAANMPTVAAYHDISNYTATLPLPLLKNGVVYAGDNGRLRRIVQKLLNGEPTSVGAIGGSISYGYGVRRGSSDWFSKFTAYMRIAFPRAPITARNGCVPAAQSEYMSMCLDKFVSSDVDLVFVEFATSDGYLDASVNNGYVHAFERLLRKLRRLPNNPAVVLINFLHADIKKNGLPFYHSIEDHYGVLAQYYQLPWLSVRDAVWHGLVNDWEGFRVQDIFLASNTHQRHPNELGHKYMADLAVALIQQTYLERMLLPLTPADMTYSEDIPPPMFRLNFETQNTACATGVELKAAVAPEHKDWYFVNEGTVQKHRWGYVSHIPHSQLVFRLDTRAASSQPIPQLTPLEKLQILQQHGMFAAAERLQSTLAALPPVSGASSPTGGGAAALPGALLAGGMQGAMQEAQRQAATAAQLLRSGQYQQFVGRERLIGGQGGGFQLPSDAHKVAATTTATGVEVLVNHPGRKLQLAAAAADQAVAVAATAANGKTAGTTGARHPSSTSNGIISNGSSRGRNVSSSSTEPIISSSGRVLIGASSKGPYIEPPPHDAVYLKPNASSSGGALTALGGKPNSLAQADMLVWIGYQKSYRMMGRARLHCISGCVCEDRVVDAWHAEKTSRLAMAKLLVTQHDQCEIGVEVLEQTSSGHSKFKVTGVMISRAVEYANVDVHAGAALMGALEQAGHSINGGN